jgi:hypothetical protein
MQMNNNLDKIRFFLNHNFYSENLLFDIVIDNQLKPKIFKVTKDQEKVTVTISNTFFKTPTFQQILDIRSSKTYFISRLFLPIIKKIKKTRDALFFTGENPYHLANKTIIASCSNDPCHLLIPDYLYINSKGYFEDLKKFDNSLYEIRSYLSFFAGSSYGYDRLNFLSFQKKNNDITNVHINLKKKIKPFQEAYKKFCKVKTEKINDIEINKYLVQIDIDGHVNSWPGFYKKLYSGRPLLKIRSSHGYRQWYYDRLRADYHYFDVKSDLSNFREKYYQALEEYKNTKVFPGREFISKMNYDDELQLAADKISFYFK